MPIVNGQTARSASKVNAVTGAKATIETTERDRGRCLGVAGAREQQVPQRVDERGGEREVVGRSSAEARGYAAPRPSAPSSSTSTGRSPTTSRSSTDLHPTLGRAQQTASAQEFLDELTGHTERDLLALARPRPSRRRSHRRARRALPGGVDDGSTSTRDVREAVRYAAERVPVASAPARRAPRSSRSSRPPGSRRSFRHRLLRTTSTRQAGSGGLSDGARMLACPTRHARLRGYGGGHGVGKSRRMRSSEYWYPGCSAPARGGRADRPHRPRH